MAGIPLPALAIRGPSPNETANAFAQAIRLRQMGEAQEQNAANDAQRNAILQQESDIQAAKQRLALQQYQQDQAVGGKINTLVPQAIGPDGKVDYGKLQSLFTQNGLSNVYPEVAKSYQAIEEANQKLDSGKVDYSQNLLKYGQALRGYAANMPHNPLTQDWLVNKIRQYDPRQADILQQSFAQNPDAIWEQITSASAKPERGTFIDASGQPFPGTILPNGQGVKNDITGQIVPGARIYKQQPVGSPRAGMVNGQRVFGIWRGDGWYSTSGKPLPGFSPIVPERSGGGSSKFSPDNPAPQSMFQAADDQKNAQLAAAESWYGEQRKRLATQLGIEPDAIPNSQLQDLNRQLESKKQIIQNQFEAQLRKLGGSPSHYSYFSPAPDTPAAQNMPPRVKVVNAHGQVGTIPASQLQQALAQGYKRVE